MARWKISSEHPVDGVTADTACRFGAQQPELVFRTLGLDKGGCFLDAGCGPGDYSLPAAERVGSEGKVISLDRDPRMLEQLRQRARRDGFENITCLEADLSRPLPLNNGQADVALISGVLHMPGLTDHWESLFAELYRVLRNDGRLGIIESRQDDAPAEYPLHRRLTPELISNRIKVYGFQQQGLLELTYSPLIWFKKV